MMIAADIITDKMTKISATSFNHLIFVILSNVISGSGGCKLLSGIF